jgi:hypothetical protein
MAKYKYLCHKPGMKINFVFLLFSSPPYAEACLTLPNFY